MTERYTAEQVALMVEDRTLQPLDWRNMAAATIRSYDARLQSLEVENARYKAALERIVSDSEVCPLDTADAETYAAIARNALKED